MSPELLVINKLKTLPIDRQHEVLDFIEFLQAKEAIGQTLVLSDRDRDQFIKALDNPPVHQGNLKTALMDYQKTYGDA